jgi:DNA polymerase elongation subunit (family B)
MLNNINLNQLVFLDIETVPCYPSLSLAPEKERALWGIKAKQLTRDETPPEEAYKRAGIYAEFGKIICVSLGRISQFNGSASLQLKSFASTDEPELLLKLVRWMQLQLTSQSRLCAHNGKEFDFPYLARRMLINGIPLPQILDTAGKRPWEVNHIDTLELWKFGDYKHYISLDQLAHLFAIPSPKSDLNGSEVGEVYWKENDLDRIKHYCENDVFALAQIVFKLKGGNPDHFEQRDSSVTNLQ